MGLLLDHHELHRPINYLVCFRYDIIDSPDRRRSKDEVLRRQLHTHEPAPRPLPKHPQHHPTKTLKSFQEP
jgi:hypothetical protein